MVLLWSSAIVAIVMIMGVPRLELTDNWTSYLSERYQFRQDTDFVIENLTGIETLEYTLRIGSRRRHHRTRLSERMSRRSPNGSGNSLKFSTFRPFPTS